MKTLLAVVLTSALALSACSGDKASPGSPTPTPPPVATPTVTGLVINGAGCTNGGTCTAPGNFAMTATAQLSNGTTQAVTTQTAWTSTNPAVASVSGSGVVSVAAVGSADVTGSYQGRSGGITVNVPAPYAQSGVGDNVFTVPSYVTRLRVDATYGGSCQNFIARISTSVLSLVNVIIGTCSVADTRSPFSGTYAISNGGVVTITSSTGIAWTFTQVR